MKIGNTLRNEFEKLLATEKEVEELFHMHPSKLNQNFQFLKEFDTSELKQVDLGLLLK